MRANVNKTLLVLALALAVAALLPASSSRAESGLMLTPATLRLSLAKGKAADSAEFTITNKYDRLVTLNFAFEPAAGTPDAIEPADHLRIKRSYVMLNPGDSLRQVVTLLDSKQLGPGSFPADLVITQTNTTSANVGVLASIRMPLVLVKEDGAVSALGLTTLSGPGLSLIMPRSLTAVIHNTGNMIAIPRGVLTVVGPGGQVLRSGALNTASLAVSPGQDLTLTTPLNQLKDPLLPGFYNIKLSYGLGGGAPVQTATTWFFYIAWWHVMLLGLVAAALYLGRKHVGRLRRGLRKLSRTHHPPPKRTMLIGRDIT